MTAAPRLLAPVAAVAAVVVGLPVGLMMFVTYSADEQAAQQSVNGCGSPAGATASAAGPVGSWSAEQTSNAVAIVNAGAAKGVNAHGQAIGLMTAIDESRLRVLNYGDLAGPSSRGLFQQQGNGAWGSYADRMDPTISSSNFFAALLKVPGWESMPPTLAAHAVQRNADPYVYAQFWDQAVALLGQLTNGTTAPGGTVELTGLAPGGGTTPGGCTGGPSLPVPAGGWAVPAVGTLASGFSPNRVNPVTHAVEPHNGEDIANACGTPIYAAHDGTVIASGPATGYGNWIRIDHGGGIVTTNGHMKKQDLLVQVGQHVTAGQQISRIGSEGQATGCHLHFQVEIDGKPTDPVPFMAQHGAPLGAGKS